VNLHNDLYLSVRGALCIDMTQLATAPVPQSTPASPRRRLTPKERLAEWSRTLPTTGRWAWLLAQRVPFLATRVNRALINQGVNVLPPRPYALSTKLDYTTQDTLVDRTFNCRQLPPAADQDERQLPDVEQVAPLFAREELVECEKSTVLFAYFAQWFTDGFLRSDRSAGGDDRDIRRNESTHEIDLAQLYGLNDAETKMLRDKRRPILLAHQGELGEELPPDLYDADGARIEQFAHLRVIGPKHTKVDNRQLLAMGSDVSNSQIGYSLLNTLFLREHNRLALELAEANPAWHEDRIFAATRSVLTVLLIKAAIEDYINHIHPYHFRFLLDPRGFDRQPWMRPNWVAVEFNLLYRWHSLIPDELDVGTERMAAPASMFRTKELLSQHGLGALIDSASRQPAGRLGLHNTPRFLLGAECNSIKAGRTVRLQGYNAYRAACKFQPARRMEDISSDPATCAALRDVYGDDVEAVDFYVGLFAETRRKNSVLPPLIGRLVGLHAFSQLLTNPLFSRELWNEETFSPRGFEIVNERQSLTALVHRNVSAAEKPLVALTRTDWKRT
jgi:prostaglandin-endoperoxide synthase 2